MNPYQVLAAAAADWDRLAGLLKPASGSQLEARLQALRSAGQDGPARLQAAEKAARLLLEALPDAESGRLDDASGARFAGDPQDRSHLGFHADDLAVLVLDGHRMVGPVLGPTRARILAVPALDPDEVRLLGGDPGAAGLLRLTGLGGRLRLPGFQFGVAGAPLPTVVEVNTLLDAERDPWGVADWWLSANAWLGGNPADLLGAGRDGQLVDAARYLSEEE
ncbi:hypothetical protein ABZW10_14540 [Kitasatospora sp. NPDC004723]|uniref:hypothetical protein n=1 Tax=Kitasatospora sp. NPDC004723 TaxID=3154288 RepID=UPI0033A8E563